MQPDITHTCSRMTKQPRNHHNGRQRQKHSRQQATNHVRKTNKQTNKQTQRQTNNLTDSNRQPGYQYQTNKQTSKQINKQTKQTNYRTDKQTDKQMHRHQQANKQTNNQKTTRERIDHDILELVVRLRAPKQRLTGKQTTNNYQPSIHTHTHTHKRRAKPQSHDDHEARGIRGFSVD